MEKITDSKEFKKRMNIYGYPDYQSIAKKMVQKGMPYENANYDSTRSLLSQVINKTRSAPKKIIQTFIEITDNNSEIINYLTAPKKKKPVKSEDALDGTLDVLLNEIASHYHIFQETNEKWEYIKGLINYIENAKKK